MIDLVALIYQLCTSIQVHTYLGGEFTNYIVQACPQFWATL